MSLISDLPSNASQMVWNSPSHQLFHLQGKLKKEFTKLYLNFLLSKSPLYKVASIFKICPNLILRKGSPNYKYNHLKQNCLRFTSASSKVFTYFCHLALTLLCSACVPVDKHLSIKFDKVLQKLYNNIYNYINTVL